MELADEHAYRVGNEILKSAIIGSTLSPSLQIFFVVVSAITKVAQVYGQPACMVMVNLFGQGFSKQQQNLLRGESHRN